MSSKGWARPSLACQGTMSDALLGFMDREMAGREANNREDGHPTLAEMEEWILEMEEWILETKDVGSQERMKSDLTCLGDVIVTDTLARIRYQDPAPSRKGKYRYRFVCFCCSACNLEYVGDSRSADFEDGSGKVKYSCAIKQATVGVSPGLDQKAQAQPAKAKSLEEETHGH